MGIARIVSCCAVAGALAVAGCGSGGGSKTSGASTTTGGQTTSSTAKATKWDGKIPPKLAGIGTRLKSAGYEAGAPHGSKSSGSVTPLIRVLMHEGAAVFIGIAPTGTGRKTLEKTVATSKGRFAAEIVGGDMFVASTGLNLLNAKAALSASQLAEFHKIVETVSDQ